jgi:hypothetical protein
MHSGGYSQERMCVFHTDLSRVRCSQLVSQLVSLLVSLLVGQLVSKLVSKPISGGWGLDSD